MEVLEENKLTITFTKEELDQRLREAYDKGFETGQNHLALLVRDRMNELLAEKRVLSSK